jgi:hypothetical protein
MEATGHSFIPQIFSSRTITPPIETLVGVWQRFDK